MAIYGTCVSFFTFLHGACRGVQLTKWMSSQKKRQIFLCSTSAEYSGAQGTTELTHLYCLTENTSVFYGLSSKRCQKQPRHVMSCQFSRLSSTLTCSCKCSTGPSGKTDPGVSVLLSQLDAPQWIQCLCAIFIKTMDALNPMTHPE